MTQAIIQKGLYQHFKGAYYKVMSVAQHSETEQALVIYQALYGDKGVWARPLSMFTEQVEHNGQSVPRFTYAVKQSEVLEVAILDVVVGREREFEAAFTQAKSIISSMSGYISHQLKHCVEHDNRYILLVEWQTLEDHTIGFRQSCEYQQWKNLLHEFYSPFPVVEHYSDH